MILRARVQLAVDSKDVQRHVATNQTGGGQKFVPKPGSHSADDPDFGYNQAHKWGSGDGLEKHKCRCQIQDQHSNHNEDHVVAVILSHFCVLRMNDAPRGHSNLHSTSLVCSERAQADRA